MIRNFRDDNFISLLTTLKFTENFTDKIYLRNEYSITIQDDTKMMCHKNGNHCFSLSAPVNTGTLLVLFQQYRIIHERYIYERVDAILDEFYDRTGE